MGFFSGLKTMAKVTPMTKAKAAKMNQQVCHSPTKYPPSQWQKLLTISPAAKVPMVAPIPLCRSLDFRVALLVDKDTARHIEEVEGYAIDDT